jgi:hypothetical protein
MPGEKKLDATTMDDACRCTTRQNGPCRRKTKTFSETGKGLCFVHGGHDGADCAICTTSLDVHSVALECGHSLHISCARMLYQTDGNYLKRVPCPVCRAPCAAPESLWASGKFVFNVKDVMSALRSFHRVPEAGGAVRT